MQHCFSKIGLDYEYIFISLHRIYFARYFLHCVCLDIAVLSKRVAGEGQSESEYSQSRRQQRFDYGDGHHLDYSHRMCTVGIVFLCSVVGSQDQYLTGRLMDIAVLEDL